MSTRIVGVDAALGMSGLCFMDGDLVKDLSVIRTAKLVKTPTESLRLKLIFETFMAYLSETSPEVVVIENQHVSRRNPKTSMGLARVRGVYQLACSLNGIPLYTLEPKEIKNGVGCKGNADKNIIQEAVVALYGHQALVQEKLSSIILTGMHKTDDMADALAMVHTFKMYSSKAIEA